MLSSLREVSVTDPMAGDARLRVPLAAEPTIMALGPNHVAAGVNERLWFYRLRAAADGTAGDPVLEKDYVTEVSAIAMSASHVAVLCAGRVIAHAIEMPHGVAEAAASAAGGPSGPLTLEARVLNADEPAASCLEASRELIYWGTPGGIVEVLHIPVRCAMVLVVSWACVICDWFVRRRGNDSSPLASATHCSKGELEALQLASSHSMPIMQERGSSLWTADIRCGCTILWMGSSKASTRPTHPQPRYVIISGTARFTLSLIFVSADLMGPCGLGSVWNLGWAHASLVPAQAKLRCRSASGCLGEPRNSRECVIDSLGNLVPCVAHQVSAVQRARLL